MKILIIHHLEPEWEIGFNKMMTSFDDLQFKFLSHLRRVKYERVILTRFEDYRLTDDYIPALREKIDKVENYGYGWEKSSIKEEIEACPEYPGNWTEDGNHSEIVWLAPFIKELKGENVFVSGAFSGECLEDLEIALTACDVKFKRVKSLIL